jgi:hypothetical protein
MKYALTFAGILTMCVPEDASLLRFALQGFAGLIVFGLGIALILDEENA